MEDRFPGRTHLVTRIWLGNLCSLGENTLQIFQAKEALSQEQPLRMEESEAKVRGYMGILKA